MNRAEAAIYIGADPRPGAHRAAAIVTVEVTPDHVPDTPERPPGWGRWIPRAVWFVVVALVLFLIFADPLLHWICYAGLDASNGAACRHVDPLGTY